MGHNVDVDEHATCRGYFLENAVGGGIILAVYGIQVLCSGICAYTTCLSWIDWIASVLLGTGI